MKKNIHPHCNKIEVVCSCGNLMRIHSTLDRKVTLDVCYACHPFYTGKQRTVDPRGRINRFNKRFNVLFNCKK